MFAHQLTHFATLVAVHGKAIMESRLRLPDTALDLYWTASKCRQDRWSRTLKALSATGSPHTVYRAEGTVTVRPELVLAEVLYTEVLSRIWAAVCSGLDRRRGRDEAGPIANSVLAGHFEARNRVLNLMVYGYGIGVEHAVDLNRCRLRAERWTDILLSFLSHHDDVRSFAFEMSRVRDWARPSGEGSGPRRGLAFPSLAVTGILGVARQQPHAVTANEDLNRRIAASILACWPAELFDSVGTPISTLQQSLLQVVADSQGKVAITQARSGPAEVYDTGGWFHRRQR